MIKESKNSKIILWDNVIFFGKVNSKFCLFELIFKDFVLVVSEYDENIKILISNKENDFIRKLRSKENLFLQKVEYFLSDTKVLYLTDTKKFNNNILLYKENLLLKLDIEDFLFENVYVIDNILVFIYNNNLYVISFNKLMFKFCYENFDFVFFEVLNFEKFNFFIESYNIDKNFENLFKV